MSTNTFFDNNENLFEKSKKMNCDNITCMANNYAYLNRLELSKSINCDKFSNRRIRNTDHERPMMFPEYRFRYLDYCNTVNMNGYTVCKSCKNCSFNKNVRFVRDKNDPCSSCVLNKSNPPTLVKGSCPDYCASQII